MANASSIRAAAAFAGLLGATFFLSGSSPVTTEARLRPAVSPRAAHGHHARARAEVPLEIARMIWEFNSSANDLGVQVMLDGEDWKTMSLTDPQGHLLFSITGKRGYAQLGMTELFFEGAEPSLDEFPLADLLALFPEGVYDFSGRTVDGQEIDGESTFTHAIPAAVPVATQVGPGNLLVISWTPVSGNPPGFPIRPVTITGYQVIVDPFQVTLPGTATSVTVPPEFVASLAAGPHGFEVLAIESGGNQTITAGSFTLP